MRTCARFLAGAALAASGLPPLIGAAVPPSIPWRHYEEPMFPLVLMFTQIQDGTAIVAFTFDDSGRVTDRVILETTHPAFAESIFSVMRRWEIDTSKLAADARREVIQYEFKQTGRVLSMTQRDSVKSVFSPYIDFAATAVMTVAEDEIDPPLQAATKVLPKYDAELRAEGVSGTATVSFVVDAEGRVRIPAIAHATEPEFGTATLEAISQWRFIPPLMGELPVQVIVMRTFRFGPRRRAETPPDHRPSATTP